MKRNLVYAGGALIAVAGLGLAWQAGLLGGAATTPTLDDGTTADYLVGSQVAVREPGAEASNDWAESQGLLRYRVEDFGDHKQLHIEPLMLQASRNGDGVFNSAFNSPWHGRVPLPELARVVADGFDMALDSGAHTELTRADSAALDELNERLDAPAGDPLIDQLIAPVRSADLPSEPGQRVVLDVYHGLSRIAATVERVDDDDLWLRLDATPETAFDGDRDSAAAPEAIRVAGRLRIDRDSGWVESMTLVRHARVQRDGETVEIDRVTRAQRKHQLVAGGIDDMLDVFWGVSPDDKAQPMKLRQSADKPADSKKVPDDLKLDERDTALTVEMGILSLHVRLTEDENDLALDSIALTELTLFDDAGEPLDAPIALQYVVPGYDRMLNSGRTFRYIPLAGDTGVLDRVASATATLTYRVIERDYPELTLDDRRQQRSVGDARLVVKPDDAADHSWWLTFRHNEDAYFSTTYARAAPGVQAMRDVPPRNSWLTAGEAELMAKVDNPYASLEYVRVQADHAPIDYPLVRRTIGATREYTVEFERQEAP